MTESERVWYVRELSSVNYVHKMLLVSKYTAIKQLVSSYLSVALSTYADRIKIKIAPKDEICLYKSRDESKVLYISGVALKLAKAYRMDASAVANQIASHFCVDSSENFRVEIVPSGWIHIEVAPSAIAACLQSLVDGVWVKGEGEEGEVGSRGNRACTPTEVEEEYAYSSSSSFTPSPFPFPPFFVVQYAHARCCSLLRLVQREGLMPMSKLALCDSDRAPQLQIPWLVDNEIRFNHPASYRLIAGLVTVVDDLVCSDISELVHWQKVALNLSRAFESFWSSCRIFGEEKIVSPELSQARIGLVIATKVALKLLLEEKLNICAIDEL